MTAKSKLVVLLSDNKLVAKILGKSIEKLGFRFFNLDTIKKSLKNEILLFIIDMRNPDLNNNTEEEIISHIIKKNKSQFIAILSNSSEEKDNVDFILNDDFSNLEDIFNFIEANPKKTNLTLAPPIKEKPISIPKASKPKTPDIPKITELSSDFITHILVVDDSKPVRKFVSKILSKKGFKVTEFTNGQELIDYLTEGNSCDIVLLDNQMPIMDGINALQELKADEKWKEIPVLFLSALTEKEKVVEALQLGAVDYMEKPFNTNEFLARINVHVKIDQLKKHLLIEKNKSDKLLLNTLPKKIVRELKSFGKTDPETFNETTIYFSDIVSFTTHSSRYKPNDLIAELNTIFTAFDDIMEKYHCERIKTIGDAYMAVCGMPEADPNHAFNIARASIEIMDFMQKRFDSRENGWEIRIGLHTGSVVGGIVGEKKYIYDVFGDTVNTSSRMESNSKPMHLNVSETTYNILKEKFVFTKRDSIEVKGKGDMTMYFLDWQKAMNHL